MFVDQAQVYVKGGDGGNGALSFRREKYVPFGGPDGGDGGRGGNVVFVVDPGERTLLNFRYKRRFVAQPGGAGAGALCHGKNGQDLLVAVPPGTIVRDAATGALVADLVKEGQQAVVARGGRGGHGNTRFKSSTNQAPRVAEKGEPGQERDLILELKLLADVGLVGFPNAGKSTLLSQATAAKPKIGAYPFTTLSPNLGVVHTSTGDFVLADIPGLIAGAHQGAGLGHDFLRHIDRTRLLLHLLDAAGTEGRDPEADFHAVEQELRAYSQRLAERPRLVVLNKMDLPEAQLNRSRLEALFHAKGLPTYSISAATGEGVAQLMTAVARLVQALPAPAPEGMPEEAVFGADDDEIVVEEAEPGAFRVRSRKVERWVVMTNLDNDAALRHLHMRLKRAGVIDRLQQAGVHEGDRVIVGAFEFIYEE